MTDKEYEAIVEWWNEAFNLKLKQTPDPEIRDGLYRFWQLTKTFKE